MLFRIAEQLRHVSLPQTFLGLRGFRRATFSFCSASLLAHTRPADDTPPSQPLQKPHNVDEVTPSETERRKKKAEYNKRYIQKKREDPVWLEQYRIRHRESNNRYVRKKSEDEAWKHKYMDSQNERWRLWVQQKLADDASRQQYMADKRIRSVKAYAASYDKRRRAALRTWFWKKKDPLDTFIWKRWRPICLPESVERLCATCRGRSIKGQRRLWFVRKSDPELWDCLSCFCSSDLSEVVPIQGAERFYNGKYLQPQSTGVEGIDHQADTQKAGLQKQDEVRAHVREHLTVKEEQGVTMSPSSHDQQK